jgi:hypothetical protein
MNPLPLEELQRRIAEQEAELARLRSLLIRLADLVRRKDDLLDQIQELDAEIHGLGGGQADPGRAQTNRGNRKSKPKRSRPTPTGNKLPSAAEMIVRILHEAGGGPMPVRDLAREARRRGLRSRSSNFRRVIETRTTEMVKNGILSRAPNRAGLVLHAVVPPTTSSSEGNAVSPAEGKTIIGKKGQPGTASGKRQVPKHYA